jgi:phosphoglycolate phosphatase-like HAD superfamily hydrolase
MHTRKTIQKKYRQIIFDFDGVLVESNAIRIEGFQELFQNYPENQVAHLVAYVRENGGISRYKKIEYFLKNISKEFFDDKMIDQLAVKYSSLVKKKVIEAQAVKGSLDFLNKFSPCYGFAIVSGSDQKELQDVCRKRGIDHFFSNILGSPREKSDNINDLVVARGWDRGVILYVGDSKNDLDAARANSIDFLGRSSGLENWEQTDQDHILDLQFLPDYLA